MAANITKILSTYTLDFSTNGYMALHRRIFDGEFKFAGQLRNRYLHINPSSEWGEQSHLAD